MKNFRKRIWDIFTDVSYFAGTLVPPLFVYIIGYFFVIKILLNLKEDTTWITNPAFVILASLSGLSFSCARAIEGDPDVRDQFAYAGERFLHAAIMCITSSIIKYAFLSLQKDMATSSLLLSTIGVISGTFVGLLFMYSLGSAHGGLIVLNKLLWKRINRYPDLNNFL